MLRETLKPVVRRLGRTELGRALIHAAVMEAPAERRLATVREWPEALDGFEDLAFLFTTNELNHGVASLTFDEAAYLYKLARSLGPATIVEVGRFKGGSTIVFATAKHPDTQVYSYDLAGVRGLGLDGVALDAEIEAALRRYGREGVHLIRADSRTASHPDGGADLVFIDGDHSYEGARADYEHWRAAVRSGGHLLFHDAAQPDRYAATSPGVTRLVAEIERDRAHGFERAGTAGSIVHLRRA